MTHKEKVEGEAYSTVMDWYKYMSLEGQNYFRALIRRHWREHIKRSKG